MNSPVKVTVVWSKDKMGRLPSGTSYTTVAKFTEDANRWPNEGWSVTLDFPHGSAQVRSFDATARFLMPNAPWGRLKQGCVFELYEGYKMAATVTVK